MIHYDRPACIPLLVLRLVWQKYRLMSTPSFHRDLEWKKWSKSAHKWNTIYKNIPNLQTYLRSLNEEQWPISKQTKFVMPKQSAFSFPTRICGEMVLWIHEGWLTLRPSFRLARFFLAQSTKNWGEIYQIAAILPNGHIMKPSGNPAFVRVCTKK
jgi:hypothetical protein